MEIISIKYHLIEGSYNQKVLHDLANANVFSGMNQLLKYYPSLKNKPVLSPQQADKLSILAQLYAGTQKSLNGIQKAGCLYDSAEFLSKHGLKTEKTFKRIVKILHKAFEIPTAPWYHSHYRFLLFLTAMPTLYGFTENQVITLMLANKKIADYACQKLTSITKVDLVMGVYDWIAAAVTCYGKQFPSHILNRTHDLLNVLEKSKSFFPPQYLGKLHFLQGFMFHYYDKKDKETFIKAVQSYKASLKTGDSSNGLTKQIQSGKYHAIFHFERLIKHPGAFGFDPEQAKQNWTLELQHQRDSLLQKGQADYRWQVQRCIGFRPQRVNNLSCCLTNNPMGQTDDMDNNYIRAMNVIQRAIKADSMNLQKVAQYKSMQVWLYLEKSHLFQNSHHNAVIEMASCLEIRLKLLERKIENFGCQKLSN